MRLLALLVTTTAALAPTRRGFVVGGLGGAVAVVAASAGATPEQLAAIGVEETPPSGDAQFTTLSNGVKVKRLRAGSGGGGVSPKSTVSVECTGRLLNLNGEKFYSTAELPGAKELGGAELALPLGRGGVVPGLEAGLIGAEKGEIRRIIVPGGALSYDVSNPAMEPNPIGLGRRTLDSVVRNPRRDAAILFDVKVVRIR